MEEYYWIQMLLHFYLLKGWLMGRKLHTMGKETNYYEIYVPLV